MAASDQASAIRAIDGNDLNWALAEGWRDFQENRGYLIFLAAMYPALGFLAALLAFNNQLLPLAFPLGAGLSIMGPAVAAGFYEMARRREEHIDPSWAHFLDPLRDGRRDALLVLSAGLLVLFLIWLGIAWAIYSATLQPLHPAGIRGFIDALMRTREGWTMIVLGNLAGAVFAVLTLVLTVVSFPMAVDRPVDPGAAVATSLAAVRRNPVSMTRWGIRVALLLALGCLPLFIGLAVVLPVLGYATWHLYTRLVQR